MTTSTSSIIRHFSGFRFVPYRMRRSLLKRLYPDNWKQYAFSVEMDGGMTCTGVLENYIDRVVFFCGAHEKYMLHFLRDVVRGLRPHSQEPLRFLDVGANIGNHSMYMSKLVDEVYAFEPFPRVREQLEKHVQMNKLHNIRIFPFALGEENSVQPFFSGPDDNLGAASFHADHYQDNVPVGQMEIRIGDEVFTQEKLGRIAIVKIDVEGFEPPVLAGLKETLRRDRPLLAVELSQTTRKQVGDEAGLYALFPENYRYYYFTKGSLDTGKYSLAPFDYHHHSKIEDVLAVPEEMVERLSFLPR